MFVSGLIVGDGLLACLESVYLEAGSLQGDHRRQAKYGTQKEGRNTCYDGRQSGARNATSRDT
jgi:hypothetical protein